jgi:hypothetical protein
MKIADETGSSKRMLGRSRMEQEGKTINRRKRRERRGPETQGQTYSIIETLIPITRICGLSSSFPSFPSVQSIRGFLTVSASGSVAAVVHPIDRRTRRREESTTRFRRERRK